MAASGYIAPVQKKTSSKAPDMRGKLVFSTDLLKEIADWFRANPKATGIDLEVAAWAKSGDRGSYYSINAKIPTPPPEQPGRTQMQFPQPAYPVHPPYPNNTSSVVTMPPPQDDLPPWAR